MSVVGTRRFASPRQKQFGFLGVMPELQDERVVLRVEDDGPAKRAGLQSGDAILTVDDKPITTVGELINTISSHSPGQKVRVQVARGEEEQEFEVTLASRPQNASRHVANAFAGGSSQRRTGFEAVFSHDGHVEPDDCGGPVFGIRGEFVGLNVARYSRTRCYAAARRGRPASGRADEVGPIVAGPVMLGPVMLGPVMLGPVMVGPVGLAGTWRVAVALVIAAEVAVR